MMDGRRPVPAVSSQSRITPQPNGFPREGVQLMKRMVVIGPSQNSVEERAGPPPIRQFENIDYLGV